MSLFSAISSIALMTMLYLFGPRDLNQEKDFLHLSPPRILRFVLYVRKVPKGKIPLASIAIQCLSILTISLQLLSLQGANIIKPLLRIMWFGKYTFSNPDNPYLQTVFCVAGIFFPGAIIIIIYFLLCTLFAPSRNG